MFISLPDVLFILEQYKYLLIFPVAILEGPIITVISGFLAYLNLLNIYGVFLLLVAADLAGDILHYAVGKYWRESVWAERYGHLLGYDEKSRGFLENHFRKHKIKTILSAKLFHGFGTAIQITAGIAGVDFSQFVWASLIGTIPKTLILLLLGYYVGSSYLKINSFLGTMAIIASFVLVFTFAYLLLNKYLKNYFIKTGTLE